MENKGNSVQDEATKMTAQDALFSKIYSAKLGYFTDNYSQLFTKKSRKMMPLINRGTWTRVCSVRSLIDNFINKFKNESIQILSLGAGLDTNYFYYEENVKEFKDCNVKYFEVDFNDITVQKIQTIKEHSELEKLIDPEGNDFYDSDNAINAPRYKLIPCDIRDTDLLADKLTQAGFDQNLATLVLTE
jgi:O-methyltransferase involved in polyketide biosynthesis